MAAIVSKRFDIVQKQLLSLTDPNGLGPDTLPTGSPRVLVLFADLQSNLSRDGSGILLFRSSDDAPLEWNSDLRLV
jgi:hypothetical protein